MRKGSARRSSRARVPRPARYGSLHPHPRSREPQLPDQGTQLHASPAAWVRLTRRRALGFLAALLSSAAVRARADAGQPVTRSNGFAVLGKPALPPDFPYFPYVNPNAPKGGTVTLASVGTFDSFNPFILRGTADGDAVAPWVVMPGGSGAGSTVGHVKRAP